MAFVFQENSVTVKTVKKKKKKKTAFIRKMEFQAEVFINSFFSLHERLAGQLRFK